MNRADRTYRYDPAVQAIPFEERTVPGMLARTVRRVPDKLFITHEERALTFREFDHEVNRYANFLGSLEMGAGKLAIMLPTCLEFVLGWFACAKLNTVYVPINIEYRGEILRHQLGKAEVTHMLIDGAFVERLLHDRQHRHPPDCARTATPCRIPARHRNHIRTCPLMQYGSHP